MDDILKNLLVASTNSLGILDIFFAFTIPFILSLVIGLFYKKFIRENQYSENFLYSLLIFSALTSIITLLIGSNIARAFGLVGALSLIRFRTAVKSPIDTIFLFWALSVGMACGTGFYFAACMIVFLGCLYLGLVMRFQFARVKYNTFVAKIYTTLENTNSLNIESKIKKKVKGLKLLHTFFDTSKNRQAFVFSIDANIDQDILDIQSFITSIKDVEDVQLLNTESSYFL